MSNYVFSHYLLRIVMDYYILRKYILYRFIKRERFRSDSMYKINLMEIKIFLTAAHYGNFSKAAEALYISQPTVTKWIKLLETELNIQLFDRTSRTVTLTPAGNLLYNKWNDLLDTFEISITDAQELSTTSTRLIHIGALYGYAYEDFFSEIINPFEQLHPKVKFDFNIYNLHELNEQTDNFDLIFTINLETYHLKNYIKIRLDDIPLFLAVSKKHKFARKKVISVTEIGFENHLIFPPEISCGAIKYASQAFKCFGIEPQFTYVQNTPSLLMKIAQNKGVCITGRPIVKGYENDIALVKLKDFPSAMYRVMAYRPRMLHHTTNDFCNYIANQFQKNNNMNKIKRKTL